MVGNVIASASGNLFGSGFVGTIVSPLFENGSYYGVFPSQPNVLFLQVPNTGFGSGTPSFSLIASGTVQGQGDWQMSLNLSLPPTQTSMAEGPADAAIATASFVTSDSLSHTYLFEGDVTVTAGFPSGTWTFSLDGTQVASGALSNFPLVPYPTQKTNGASSTTTKIRRTLAFSLGVQAPTIAVFSDTFDRANENPLNPTNWTQEFESPKYLGIVSDTCVATGSGFSATGVATANNSASGPGPAGFLNQWAEIEIERLSGSTDGLPNSVALFVGGLYGYTLEIVNANPGDVFLLVATYYGLFVYQNGIQTTAMDNPQTPSVIPELGEIDAGIEIYGSSELVGVTNFSTGYLGYTTCTLQVSE